MNRPSNEHAVFVYITRAFWFVLVLALLKINGNLDSSWWAVTFVFWGPLFLLQVMFACCTIYLCAEVTLKGLYKIYRRFRFREYTEWNLDKNTNKTIGYVLLHAHGGNIQEARATLIKNPDEVRERILEEIEKEFNGDRYANPGHPQYTDEFAGETAEEYADKRDNARNLRRVDLDEKNEIIVLEIVEECT